MKHPLIIGAGGVASYLLPVLLKTFRPEKLTIVDKDILEERNLDRQMFPVCAVGQNKAQALASHTMEPYRDTRITLTVIPDWFTDSTVIPDDVDAIICMADNHEARMNATRVAARLGIIAYIGGNEYLDSQAFIYDLKDRGTSRDPLVRYPNIATDTTGSPTSCQGVAQIASPQLALANLSCAAKILHLLWVYERWLPENSKCMLPEDREVLRKVLPCELFTSLTENSATSA